MEQLLNILTNFSILWIVVPTLIVLLVLVPFWLRVVVPTNAVHIVQSSKRTLSYGKGLESGNTYYAFPSWIPRIGVVTSHFTLSVFSVSLKSYEAYDVGRLPFLVDVIAFFRISDSTMAAERVQTFVELESQLQNILQGAVRSILAKNELEHILSERSTFSTQFTSEVESQLKEWGCNTVKNIEFMDIRDAQGSQVIHNIMSKKMSKISMESRQAVALNDKLAQIAEIEATQEADIKRQEALQMVGVRTAEKDKAVGISKEQSTQEIRDQEKITTEKTMAVQFVQEVRQAEITKGVQVVAAEQSKQTTIIIAEGVLENTRRMADGVLATATREAESIELKGKAAATAEKLMQLATVDPQITLAKEIGANSGYQNYLVSIRSVEMNQAVGIEQAQALKTAGIKVIANTGNVSDGVKSVMDLFTPKGGLSAGAALEAFANTDSGAALLKKFGLTKDAAIDALSAVEKD